MQKLKKKKKLACIKAKILKKKKMRSLERGKISSSTESKLHHGMYVRITHSITPETRNEEAALIHCNMTRGISVFIVALHFVSIKHTLGALAK